MAPVRVNKYVSAGVGQSLGLCFVCVKMVVCIVQSQVSLAKGEVVRDAPVTLGLVKYWKRKGKG